MSEIRAVLFDVIGTAVLENDPEFINHCFYDAFLANEIQVSKAQILHVGGKDKREAILEIMATSSSGPNLQSRVFEDFCNNVSSGTDNFREHPELTEVINFLKSRSIIVGVGSGLPKSIFERIFEHLQWERYHFDYTAVFEDFPAGRPAPFMIFDLCERFGLQPQQVLKVGDTVSDILEGKNANSPTAVIFYGTQSEDLLRAANPDYELKSLEDVLSIFP